MFPPDRLSTLIQRLEAGQAITQPDVDRVAALQALDLAKLGEDFARATIDSDNQLTQDLAR